MSNKKNAVYILKNAVHIKKTMFVVLHFSTACDALAYT